MHPLNGLIKDVRDHIRHDFREEFDKVEKRKSDRASRLKIDGGLQVAMRFETAFIEVGRTQVTVKEISAYLKWANTVINKAWAIAKERGYIKPDANY